MWRTGSPGHLDRDDLDDYVVMSTNDMPADGSHPVLDRDEVHDIYREWRREVFNRYDPPRFAVAEAWARGTPVPVRVTG